MARGDDFDEDDETGTRKVSPALIIIVIVAVLAAVGLYFALTGNAKPGKPEERKIVKISLPPPPPPPPPPPEPKPKPIEEPKDTPQELTPDKQQPTPDKPKEAAALTSAGPAGDDAFGAVAGAGGVGNRIGGCTGPNCGDGGGGARLGGYGEYNTIMGGVVQRALKKERGARGRYELTVNVIVGPDGAIREARLVDSTGDQARDRLIQQTLIGLGPDRAPSNLPKSATIRVTVRLS